MCIKNLYSSSLICGSDCIVRTSGVVFGGRLLCWDLSGERLLSRHAGSDHLLSRHAGSDHLLGLYVLHLLLGLDARLLIVLHLLLAWLRVVLHLGAWLLVVSLLCTGLGTGLGRGHLIVLLRDRHGAIGLSGVGSHAKFALPSLLPDAADAGDDNCNDDEGGHNGNDPPKPD